MGKSFPLAPKARKSLLNFAKYIITHILLSTDFQPVSIKKVQKCDIYHIKMMLSLIKFYQRQFFVAKKTKNIKNL